MSRKDSSSFSSQRYSRRRFCSRNSSTCWAVGLSSCFCLGGMDQIQMRRGGVLSSAFEFNFTMWWQYAMVWLSSIDLSSGPLLWELYCLAASSISLMPLQIATFCELSFLITLSRAGEGESRQKATKLKLFTLLWSWFSTFPSGREKAGLNHTKRSYFDYCSSSSI